MANPNAKAVVCGREAPGRHVGALPRIKRPHSYQTQHLEPAKRPNRDTQPPREPADHVPLPNCHW